MKTALYSWDRPFNGLSRSSESPVRAEHLDRPLPRGWSVSANHIGSSQYTHLFFYSRLCHLLRKLHSHNFRCRLVCNENLTIIPRVALDTRWYRAHEACSAELAIIISYPTIASGIIVLLKTPTKCGEFFPTLFVKTTDFQLVFNFEQTRTVTIFGEHGIMAHIPWWLSQSEL